MPEFVSGLVSADLSPALRLVSLRLLICTGHRSRMRRIAAFKSMNYTGPHL